MNQFISFPKSGRTWIRYCLLQYGITDEQVKFHHDGFEYSSKKDPELNFNIDERIQKYKDEPIVFMKRNFLDTYLSFYHQIRFRFKDIFNIELTLEELAADPYFGYSHLLSFHQMQSQVLKQLNNKVIIDYEKCQQNMYDVMHNILTFYNIPINEIKLKEAVNSSTFNEMRKIEKEESFDKDWLLPRNNSYKTRKGKVGSFYEETDLKVRHNFNDILMNHSIIDNNQFICLIDDQTINKEGEKLIKEIDFWYKRYNKKLEIIELNRLEDICKIKVLILKAENVVIQLSNEFINLNIDIMELLNKELLKNQIKHKVLNVLINNENDNTILKKYDMKINLSELNKEQATTKFLSEIHYHALYVNKKIS